MLNSYLHHILRMATDEGAYIFGGDLNEALAGFERGPGYVWGDVGIGDFQQGIIRLGRLLCHNIGTIGLDAT